MEDNKKYDVILADPPWRYDFSKSNSRKIENQYPTMSTEEICKINVPSKDNCVLFLWATMPKLQEALEMLYDMAKCYVETHPEITFKGVHLVEFENTSPMDGGIIINGKPVTESTLTAFMGDELPDEWYTSFHKQAMTEKERTDLKFRRSGLVYNETEINKDLIMTKVRPL